MIYKEVPTSPYNRNHEKPENAVATTSSEGMSRNRDLLPGIGAVPSVRAQPDSRFWPGAAVELDFGLEVRCRLHPKPKARMFRQIRYMLRWVN